MEIIKVRVVGLLTGRWPNLFGIGSLRFYPQMFEGVMQGSAYGEYWISRNPLEEGASFMRHKGDFSTNKVS